MKSRLTGVSLFLDLTSSSTADGGMRLLSRDRSGILKVRIKRGREKGQSGRNRIGTKGSMEENIQVLPVPEDVAAKKEAEGP